MAENEGKDLKFALMALVLVISLAINVSLYLNSQIANIVFLALGITAGFIAVSLCIYFMISNPLIKMRIMRLISPAKNYGIFAICEPGKSVLLKVVSFKTTHFKDGERLFPMPEERYIKRIGNGPLVLFDSRDAKAVLLDGEKTDEITRDPGKLHAFCDLYTALAEASARRKNRLNVKQLMMILYGILVLCVINVYFGYSTMDFLNKQMQGIIQTAITVGMAAAKGVTG